MANLVGTRKRRDAIINCLLLGKEGEGGGGLIIMPSLASELRT